MYIEEVNKVIVNKDELNKVLTERKDFGFDSLYFRYASAIDEIVSLKNKPNANRDWTHWGEGRKKRFWEILEQLLEVHE